MDQHEQIGNIGATVRRAIVAGDESTARVLLDELLEILEPHVAWEEVGLFARMTAQGDFPEHVESLEAEHLALWTALDAAAEHPHGWGAAVSQALDDLDEHIYRENFGLFPGAIAVLDAADWAAINACRPALERGSHGLHTV